MVNGLQSQLSEAQGPGPGGLSGAPLRAAPLLWVAGAMAVGGLAAANLPLSWGGWLVAMATTGGAVAVLNYTRRQAGLVGWGLLLVALAAQGAMTRYRLDAMQVPPPWADGSEVRLTVGPLESLRPVGRRSAGWLAEAQVVGGGGGEGGGRVRLYFRQEERPPDGAGRVVVRGVFRAIDATAGPGNPGEADTAWYDRLAGVVGEVQVRAVEGTAGGRSWWARARQGWREFVRARLSEGMTEGTEPTLLLASLLLGESEPGLAAVREDFQRTGTTHHLAVSGTHVAIVAGLALGVLRVAAVIPVVGGWFSPRRILLGASVVVVLYGAAVSPGPAVARAVVLTCLTAVGLSLGRAVSAVNLLGACAVALLLADPVGVFVPGFQLTFAVLWAVLVPGRRLVELVHDSRDRDLVVVDLWRPGAFGARWRRWQLRAGQAMGVGLVAWAASSLLVAHHFWQANPYAALSSLMLTPAVTLALTAGCAKVVLSAVCPWGDGAWAAMATASAGVLRWSVGVLAEVPGSRLGVPPLPGWAAAMGLLGLGVPAWVAGASARRRWGVWVVVLVGVVVLPMLPRVFVHRDPGLTATVLGLEGGRAMVVQVDDAAPVWIDAGTRGRQPGEAVVRRTMSGFMAYRNEREAGVAVVSGWDAGSAGALEAMVEGGVVGRVYGRVGGSTGERHAGAEALTVGSTLRFGGMSVDVLHPRPGNSEEDGLVLRLTYAGRTVVYCGRLSDSGVRALLASRGSVACDVLVLPAGGADPTRLARLVEASGASVVLSREKPGSPGAALAGMCAYDRAVELRITPAGGVTVAPYRR